MAAIIELNTREILDSHGNLTVEVEVPLEDDAVGRAVVLSDASTGAHEAHELRDDGDRYLGKGAEKAVRTVLEEIEDVIIDLGAEDRHLVDKIMTELDNAENKSRLGVSATLDVSVTIAKATAESVGLDLSRYVGGPNGHALSVPMMSILNGSVHADSGADAQEFMTAPADAPTFKEALRIDVEVYHALKKVIKDEGLSTGLDDEGGFVPSVDFTKTALDLIVEVVEAAGYKLGDNIALILDAASSGFYKGGKYHFEGDEHTAEEIAAVYADLAENYVIVSIEDLLQEDNWEGYTKLTAQISDRVWIIDDDFFATNPKRLVEGIEKKAVSALLVKVSQAGSLFETLKVVAMAYNAGYRTMMLHHSGETEDTTIADLAVGLNCGQIKIDVPARPERVAKYSQLLHIEGYLGDVVVYASRSTFSRFK